MASEDQNLLVMTAISKTFPGVHALENVDFSLRKGEIHCLIGENGAGKSTLIKVLTGADFPDTGKIILDGKEIHVRSPQHAQELGISTVYQEINLCMNLSVAENILLGREPHNRVGGIDLKTMNSDAAKLLVSLLGISIDVTQRLDTYSVAIQQMVAIARALDITSAKILILDEPTSSLDTLETQQLFKVMRKLRSDGVGIIFITHFINQVFEISDRITVLRNGKLVGTFDTASLSKVELITKMIGRSLVEFDELTKVKRTEENQVEGKVVLSAKGLGRIDAISPTDLELRNGEVVGLAGLLGSGRTEIANLLFGSEKPDSGTITMNGKLIRTLLDQSSKA
jgi:monosaccharide-transporting ATPase